MAERTQVLGAWRESSRIRWHPGPHAGSRSRAALTNVRRQEQDVGGEVGPHALSLVQQGGAHALAGQEEGSQEQQLELHGRGARVCGVRTRVWFRTNIKILEKRWRKTEEEIEVRDVASNAGIPGWVRQLVGARVVSGRLSFHKRSKVCRRQREKERASL